MNLKEKRLEAIKELILPYWRGEKMRSVYDGRCKYNHPDGHHCAFAEACVEDTRRTLTEGRTAANVIAYKTESILKPKYRGLFSNLEWNAIQKIHDTMPAFYVELTTEQPHIKLDRFDEHLKLDGKLADILKVEEANFQ